MAQHAPSNRGGCALHNYHPPTGNKNERKTVFVRTAYTLAIGAAGGGIFVFGGLPAAWLSGAMVAVGIATLSGLPVAMPQRLRDIVFVFLGISMGSGVTPETLHQVATWPLSIAALAVVVTAIILFGTLFLTQVARWDRPTAFFASVPGALSYVLALALTTRADLRRVAISQSLRLFVLVAILPSIITMLRAAPLAAGPVAQQADWQALALLIGCGVASGLLFHWLKVPAGLLTGGLTASAILHVTETVTAQLPNMILVPGFIVLGAMIGTRFAGSRWRDLATVAATSLAAFAIAMVVSVLGAALVAAAFGLPIGQTLLAFAPGGLEVMMVLAFALDLDPAYVGAHQVARFFAMALLLPLIIRLFGIRAKKDAEGQE